MNYQEYIDRKLSLEAELTALKLSYVDDHGFLIGTPVIYRGHPAERLNNCKCFVSNIHIFQNGDVYHTIIKAKKDGSRAIKGDSTGAYTRDLELISD
jgi:hypothetical protein